MVTPPDRPTLGRVVCGLGNPGADYDWTPHNLGFHVVERLARGAGPDSGPSSGSGSEAALFEHADHSPPRGPGSGSPDPGRFRGPTDFLWAWLRQPEALLVKPVTYMNLSGEVVAPIVRWLDLDPRGLMVVYDDLDLEPGALRIRPHGGTGGHRGMESIVQSLGTDRFPRLRVGVGRPRTDAARHVLAKLTGEALRVAETSVEEASLAIREWLETGDVERVMTRFHSRWKQQAAERAAPTEEEAK